jgi:P-type conjugative transfer protein TrbL
MDIITTAAQSYIHFFHGLTHQFLAWGRGLFFALLTINLTWIALWYAFDRSLSENFAAFIQRFFVMTFFYTLMIHPAWLGQVLKTVQYMGHSVVHAPIDPSSIIEQGIGIGIGNQLLIPVTKSSLLTMGFGLIIVAIVYLIVLFVFIHIALDLAVTLIITTALICLSTFFLSFAALNATSAIARQTLDLILANCVKLLGLYLVVAAGSQTMASITRAIPQAIETLDPYAWICACALLFWLVAKQLPNQLARLVHGAVQEMPHTRVGSLVLSNIQTAKTALSVSRIASSALNTTARNISSAAYSAVQSLKNLSRLTKE